jgi:hypothetical protein
MSNAIDFLERVGQDAQLRYAGRQALEDALRKSDVVPSLQSAMMDDSQRLALLLGADANVCCVIFPVEDGDAEIRSNPTGKAT